MPLIRAIAASLVAVVVSSGTAQATPHSRADSGLGRVVIVVAPEVYDDLLAHGVAVEALGSGRVVPFEGTVKIKLPVEAVSGSTAELGGGIRLTAADSQLALRKIILPASGLVTGKLRSPQFGNIGGASVFIQSPSDSELGDTLLQFTYTYAYYVNLSFDTTYDELGDFGYSTTHLR